MPEQPTRPAGSRLQAMPGLEHEYDAGQRGPITDRPTPRIAMPPRSWWWQQRLDPLPQSVGDQFLDHPDQRAQGPPSPAAAMPRPLRNDL
jgi:hypothetical protein